jgi:hypothetical protein
VGCLAIVVRDKGQLAKVEADIEHLYNRGRICIKGQVPMDIGGTNNLKGGKSFMKVVRSGMSPTLTIAATSASSEMANIDANLKKAEKIIDKATEKGTEVVVFPETYLTGYTCGEVNGKFFELAEPIPGPSTDFLVKLTNKYNVYMTQCKDGFVRYGGSYVR